LNERGTKLGTNFNFSNFNDEIPIFEKVAMKGFFNSLQYAFKGIRLVFSGRNFRIQFALFVLAVCAGVYFHIARFEWLSIFALSALVLGSEAINTSIEQLCDLYSKEHHPKIERIKDMAAGGVLIICFFALIGGILIFYKYFF
jgi:diacylglycerol kinase